MNAKRRLVLLVSSLGLALLFNSAAEANPEAAVNFSQTTSSVPVVAQEMGGDDPQVLRTVRVKCPQTGFLVARAEAGFHVLATGGPNGLDQFVFTFDLAKNQLPLDLSHNHEVSFSLFGSLGDQLFKIPGSIQRVDRCEAGSSQTYRFGAFIGDGIQTLNAIKPNLVVEFFRDRL